MKCVICHGEEIKVIEVKEELSIGNDIVFIPIKVSVCHNCGERYYDRQTMHYLEQVEDKLKRKELELREIGRVLEYG